MFSSVFCSREAVASRVVSIFRWSVRRHTRAMYRKSMFVSSKLHCARNQPMLCVRRIIASYYCGLLLSFCRNSDIDNGVAQWLERRSLTGEHSPITIGIITQPWGWYSFTVPRRVEGWVDPGTAVSVQPVPKAAYRSDFRENTNSVRSAIRTWVLSRRRQACYH